MVISAGERDLEVVRNGLARWLSARRPGAGDLRVAPITKPSVGFSSDTLFVDISFTTGGIDRTEQLVARLPPAADGVFPRYDLSRQARLQEILATTHLPVPRPLGVELDESWIGAPFLLMPRISGRVLSNNPSYLEGSWLHDATESEQAELHHQFVDILADLHRLDWKSLGLEFLVPTGKPELSAELDRWEDYLGWAADGSPPSILAETFGWCRENRPDPEPPASLVWGDPGFSNVIFGENREPVALLDWELATVAPAEVDLTWFLAFHTDAVSRSGVDMPGFPERPAVIARYQEHLGRPVISPGWFEVFTTACGASCLVRMQKLYAALGVTDEEEVAQHPGFGDRLTMLMARAERESC